MSGHLEGSRSENPVPAHASFLIFIFAEEDVGLRDMPHNPAAFAAMEVLFPGFLRSQAISLAQLQKRVHDFHITLPSLCSLRLISLRVPHSRLAHMKQAQSAEPSPATWTLVLNGAIRREINPRLYMEMEENEEEPMLCGNQDKTKIPGAKDARLRQRFEIPADFLDGDRFRFPERRTVDNALNTNFVGHIITSVIERHIPDFLGFKKPWVYNRHMPCGFSFSRSAL